MPFGTPDKSNSKKWGFRRLSLTKPSFGKQNSIDSNNGPAQVDNHEKILVGSSPKEKAPVEDIGEADEITNLNSKQSVCDDEEEELDVTGHQTVLKHLATQVKVGMDLTRVTLPTFILEKRSLLEMYADFFAHPEFFVLTTRENNAKLRFMYIVKWYLSSFHTGRKGAVAKKPFNPILGETFRCHWKLPTTILPSFSQNLLPSCDESCGNVKEGIQRDSLQNGAECQKQLVESGPVPWACAGDATFVAEQVSHHPPISAFYAECIDKKVEVNGYIHPKSKFLGLSIGVNMIGEAKVKLLDRKEEYTVTFPSAYGRSILTVPWAELGGKCQITCESSGYKAAIVFHTKNFYSKDRHMITCDCFDPSGSKFCVIKGQWNDKMYIMSPGQEKDQQKTSTEIFLDTTSMKGNSKQVRPLQEQGENESRSLWRNVISALKVKDLDTATNEKKKLEEKQRNDAKMRLETKQTWETQEFSHAEDGAFLYKHTLSRRLEDMNSTCSEVD